MCGIAGILSLTQNPISHLKQKLHRMQQLLTHRGPDGVGYWIPEQAGVGLTHRRLSIIDLSDNASQPMIGEDGNVLILNGEIYNHRELRASLAPHWHFKSQSDTEVILGAYQRYGLASLDYLRGMFAFALWDKQKNTLVLARDRFGIKPLYYTQVADCFLFASEAKALLPFISNIQTDQDAFIEYITYQQTIGSQTLFKGIHRLPPAHYLTITDDQIKLARYWDVSYDNLSNQDCDYYEEKIVTYLSDSISKHMVSDVPLGAHLSGGLDSSIIAALACRQDSAIPLFHGKFSGYAQCDESYYAQLVASELHSSLHVIDITPDHFTANIQKIIYHLDYPVAGPGAFAQYLVSELASNHVKVVLGGQGGDEIFGGYARYLIAYLEQCIKAAIEGTSQNGNFVVTLESIIPQLISLKEYQPLIKKFWSEGLFDSLDKRYFRLIDRSNDFVAEINWDGFDRNSVAQQFENLFHESSLHKTAYFNNMTHFDFKYLLPGLLHVEDRMSMAHGLETRVPFLDHPLVEFAAAIPAIVKFKNGELKTLLRKAFGHLLPAVVLQRTDKMGFPVPLHDWVVGPLRDFIYDVFTTGRNKRRDFVNYDAIIHQLHDTTPYSRKLWALLSYELWHQQFHDCASQIHFESRDCLELIEVL